MSLARILPALATALPLVMVSAPAHAGPEAMTPEEARHLISRTGFGASPDEIAAFAGLSYEEGVSRLLQGVRDHSSTPMPGWTETWPYPQEVIWTLGQTAEEAYHALRWIELGELQQWWLAEMIATPSPLTARLTLFWHDHFAVSFEGTEYVHWMAGNNALLRRHAAGSFAVLAEEILRDPAMLVYLTNTENLAEAPNENLAREYLELFTLGEGRGYSERDVREAARALTGHGIAELAAPGYRFHREDHDRGRKTILAERGRHDAPDLARIVLSHPEFGPYIVEKLWLEFVSDRPDPAEVARLVAVWRDHDLQMQPLLRELFLTEAFWDPANRGRLVKDPIELFVGTVRSLGLEIPNMDEAMWMLAEMGQQPFYPPNVGGWPSGTAWITDASVTARASFLTWFGRWDLEPFNDPGDGGAMRMMAGPLGAPSEPVTPGDGDLRVGQVFALEAEARDAGRGGVFVLYDVGWAGQDWRSLAAFIEQEDENALALGVYTGDCAPECFASWPWQEDGWVYFAAWDAIPGELGDVSRSDMDLMLSLISRMPELVATTEGQLVWQDRFRQQEGQSPMAAAEMVALAEDLREVTAQITPMPDGALVLARSARGDIGFGGLQDYVLSLETGRAELPGEAEEVFESLERATRLTAAPPVTYDSAAEWLAALPEGGLDSARAETALLAVPLPGEGRRMSLREEDPEALVRALILHPHFQLN